MRIPPNLPVHRPLSPTPLLSLQAGQEMGATLPASTTVEEETLLGWGLPLTVENVTLLREMAANRVPLERHLFMELQEWWPKLQGLEKQGALLLASRRLPFSREIIQAVAAVLQRPVSTMRTPQILPKTQAAVLRRLIREALELLKGLPKTGESLTKLAQLGAAVPDSAKVLASGLQILNGSLPPNDGGWLFFPLTFWLPLPFARAEIYVQLEKNPQNDSASKLSRFRIYLETEHLGTVRADIAVSVETLNCCLWVADAEKANWLADRTGPLRQSLQNVLDVLVNLTCRYPAADPFPYNESGKSFQHFNVQV